MLGKGPNDESVPMTELNPNKCFMCTTWKPKLITEPMDRPHKKLNMVDKNIAKMVDSQITANDMKTLKQNDAAVHDEFLHYLWDRACWNVVSFGVGIFHLKGANQVKVKYLNYKIHFIYTKTKT